MMTQVIFFKTVVTQIEECPEDFIIEENSALGGIDDLGSGVKTSNNYNYIKTLILHLVSHRESFFFVTLFLF